MENKEIKESFDILLTVCRIDDNKLDIAYKQMRDLLERLCRSQMQNESLQMTDLSARISFVAARTGLSARTESPAYFPPDFKWRTEP